MTNKIHELNVYNSDAYDQSFYFTDESIAHTLDNMLAEASKHRRIDLQSYHDPITIDDEFLVFCANERKFLYCVEYKWNTYYLNIMLTNNRPKEHLIGYAYKLDDGRYITYVYSDSPPHALQFGEEVFKEFIEEAARERESKKVTEGLVHTIKSFEPFT